MAKSSEKTHTLKVIVVGGGIAGLTLANSLERTGIDYILLERRGEIAPQVGASIGLLPNGCRILDQLGVYNEIKSHTTPPKGNIVWVNNGTKVTESHTADLLNARFGYQTVFLERQIVLRTLFERLEDKSRIVLNSHVLKVDHSEKSVTVHCNNGDSYNGDIVVAADGVNSFTRSEMRRYADTQSRAIMGKDKQSLSAEYKCLFGISTPVPGIEEGYLHRAYNKGFSFMTIGGKDERCYFFVFKKLDKRYFGKEIPTYTKAEEESHAQFFLSCVVGGTDGTTKFSDVWSRRVSSKLVATEEAHNENWCWGRFACVGDSIHKVTPNAGAGGNGAIESAAALANSLYTLAHGDNDRPGFDDISKALKSYHRSRKDRMKSIVRDSNNLTRYEAFRSWKHRLLTLYFIPYAGDFIANGWSNTIVGATKLDFLPRPRRTIGVNMPFDTERGIGKGESFWRRVMFALPLLGLAYAANIVLNMTLAAVGPYFRKAVATGLIEEVSGTVSVRKTFTGVVGLDDFVRVFVTAFTPSMAGFDHGFYSGSSDVIGHLLAPQRLQMISFLADLAPVHAIWMIESLRRGNAMTIATLPILFASYYQLKGIGLVAPVYYFIHYVSLPPSKYHAADNRLVRTSYAKTLIPALAIGYLLPTFGMYSSLLSLDTRQIFNFIWQFFPLWTTLLSGLFARLVKDTTQDDKIHNVVADLPYLRATYSFVGVVSAATYLYVYCISPLPLSEIFLSDIGDPAAPIGSLTEGMGRFLKYDYLFAFVSGGLWILLCFWDLKKDSRVRAGWTKILGVMVAVTVSCGPGAMMVVMWAWREEILARKEI